MTLHWLIVCTGLFLSSAASAEIYKWVDEEGNTHFGDRPTQGQPVKKIHVKERKLLPIDLSITPYNYKMPYATKEKTERAIRTMRRIFLNAMGMKLSTLDQFTIKVFGERNEFNTYQRQYYSGAIENASGVYSSKLKEAIVWKNSSVKRMLKVLTHEMSHALFDIEFEHRPLWLNEGIAEYVEELDVFSQTVYVRPNKYWKNQLRQRYRNGALPPLKEFLSWDWRGWRKFDHQTQGMGYAMGWSICFMLMDTRNDATYMKSLISDLHKHKALFNSVQSINGFYPGGIDAFQADWNKWVNRAYVPGHSY